MRDWLRRAETYTIPGVFVLVVGSWELLVRALGIPPIVIPAPSAVARALVRLLSLPSFWTDIKVTLFETLAGFAIGAASAIVVGGLIAQFRLLERTVYPYLVGIQTVPKIAIAPILVIWFGFGLASKVVVSAVIVFFPILVNVIQGLGATRQQELDLLRAMCASRWQIFWKVKVPNALPFLFAGLNIGIVFSVLGAIVGEFVGAQVGLGYRIQQLNFTLDIAGMFAVLVVLGAIGITLHLLMRAIQRRVVFWAEPDRVSGA
ncbi:MAG TPA: ABC transporter permease [Thermodesulfobacteriota bacterium]